MNEDVIDADSTALAVIDGSTAIAPAVTPADARAAMQQYFELCEAVLSDDDYQEFTQKKKVDGRWVSETKRFKKKSAVKKLQTFWNVEVTAPEAHRDDMGDGHFAFRVRAVARCKNGRVVEAWGGCSTLEERFDVSQFDNESAEKFEWRRKKALARAYHDVLSTAETRATNRAVMNAIGVGGGEVTADEMVRTRNDQRRQEPASPHDGDGNPDAEARKLNGMRKWLFSQYAELRNDDFRHELCRRLFARESINDLNDAQLRALKEELDTIAQRRAG